MHQIFESECNPDARVTVKQWPDRDVKVHVEGNAECLEFGMVREDAEAMARAILGIPDLPFFDWDGMVAECRQAVELERYHRALEAPVAGTRAHAKVS
jgi:hypothetical protein